MKILENVKLAPYTTFKIGGKAKFFGVVESVEDLKEGVNFSRKNSLPLFVLGGGSNLLISDEGFDGLVLKIKISHLALGAPSGDEVEIIAGAGVILDDLIKEMAEKGFTGMENMSWIPGTVGASAVQNCGAFGTEAGDLISWVEVFDTENQEIFILKNKECGFVYRGSIFKQKKNWVIVQVAYLLKKSSVADVQKKRNEIVEKRRAGFPLLEGFGSAGCYFKNPIISKQELEKLQKKFQDFPFFEEGQNFKIPVAWFVEKLGWKGHFEKNVGVYPKHSLILVKKGEATSEDIKKLSEKIKKDVFEKTGLRLEEEVEIIK